MFSISSAVTVILSLLVLCKLASAIYEDQDGLYDWHKQHIGRVKLADFNSVGARKRAYVVTEKNILASLNLRTGEIVWRQFLGPNDPISALHLSTRYVTTLSSSGKILRAWSLVDGALVWEASVPSPRKASSAVVDFIALPGEGPSYGDFFILSGSTISRIAGIDGKVLWQTSAEASRIMLSKGKLVAVSFQEDGKKEAIQLARFSVESGEKGNDISVSLHKSFDVLLTEETILLLNPEERSLYTVTVSDERNPVAVAEIEGSDLSGVVGFHQTKLKGGFGLVFNSFVAVVRLGEGGKLRMVAKLEKDAILSDELVVGEGESSYAVISQEKTTDGNAIKLQVFSHTGEAVLGSEGSVKLPLHRGSVQRAFLNSYSRKEGPKYGFRLLLIGQDDSVSLVQQGSVVWEREEALASIVSTQFLDLPSATEGTTAGSIEHSLEEWFMKQFLKTKKLLGLANSTELQLVRETELNSWAKNAPTRDHNGFRKLLLALTESGKLFGLHTGNGRALFSVMLPSLQPANPLSPAGKPKILDFLHLGSSSKAPGLPQLLVVSRAGAHVEGTDSIDSVKTRMTIVDSFTGEEVSATDVDFVVSLTLKVPFLGGNGVLFVGEDWQEGSPLVHVFPPTAKNVEAVQRQGTDFVFFMVDKHGGSVSGYSLGACTGGSSFESVEIWKMVFPEGSEKVDAVAARRTDEHVHTQTRPRPDRGVQFKFLHSNLLFLATTAPPKPGESALNPEESAVVAYLVDTVSGRLLYRATHPQMSGPVHAVFSDNWVVYHYFNLKYHRFEVSVLELYDQSEQASGVDIAKYVLGLGGGQLSAPQSSWHAPQLEVKAQSYFFSYSVKSMAVTSTARGITAKQVLLGLTGGQILALDKRLLDPRRTAAPTQQEKEEGILPYAEALPVNPTAYLTHGFLVEGLQRIITEPSRLESTTLVFAHGIDIFYTRTAPSKTFDTLSEDFSYVLLLVTILVLVVAIGVTYVLGERRELKLKWK